jgi:hypothetical protein
MLKITKDLRKEFSAALQAQKRVSKIDLKELETNVEIICSCINMINNSAAYVSSLGGTSFEDWKIPSELKGFIYPSQVVQDPTKVYSQNDWLDRDYSVDLENVIYTYGQFMDAMFAIYQVRKAEPNWTDAPSVSSLRQVRAISDVEPDAYWADGESVMDNPNSTTLPICISSQKHYKSSIYSQNIETKMKDVLRNIVATIGNK